MMRRVVALVLAAFGLTILVAAPNASAVSEPTSGWWSRAATTSPADEVPAALPVPAPTTPDTVPVGATVPEGQLLVEGTPEGAVALAAVRWQLDDGESSPSLTLPIAEGSTVAPTSIVLACRAGAPWTPPESGAGTWDTHPLVDGTRCVNGVVADDLSSISFGIQLLVSGSTLDVVLTPGKDPTVEVPAGVPEPPADIDGSTFRWMFPAPSADSLVVVEGDFEEGADDQVVVPESPQSEIDASDGGLTGSVGVSGPVTAAGPVIEPVPDTASLPVPDLEPEDLAAPVPEIRRAVDNAAVTDVDRTIGFVFLALAGAMAVWAHLAPEPGTSGGLGRFVRPREGNPTPLT